MVAYRAHAATSGIDATAEGSLPAGVTQDDYLIAFFMHSSLGADVTTAPSGWTDIGADPPTGDFSLKAYGRVYQSGDSAPTVTWDVAGNWAVDIVAYSGVDTTTPISGSGSGVSSGTVSSLDIGPVTPGVDDCLLVVFCNADVTGAARTYSTATMTERVGESTNEHSHTVQDEQLSGGSGTPVTRTVTISGTAQHLAGYIYALAPAAAGGVDAEVLAVAATATATAVAPQNVKGAARAVAVTATATATALAPTVSILGGGDASVSAVAATATATAVAPTVEIEAEVAAVAATATAQARAPQVTGGALVAAVAATATALAPAPTVEGIASPDANVAAPAATVTAAAVAPSIQTSSVTDAVVATGTVSITAPTVTAIIVLRFTPPTYERPIRSAVRPLNFFRQTYAQSLVRVNGSLRLVSQPTADQLEAAGQDGVDYFIGGHIYEVTAETAAELTAAGYSLI